MAADPARSAGRAVLHGRAPGDDLTRNGRRPGRGGRSVRPPGPLYVCGDSV
ncbi:hypothetical protein ACFPM0_27170 [Pseudonocardia sulfidoxydans]|uniref:hypothetical protein n=1 Tax=Pseudonocardia sulfidoxydans TaxID=54011 RepID=UPI00361106A7